jgi:hypothetical protein
MGKQGIISTKSEGVSLMTKQVKKTRKFAFFAEVKECFTVNGKDAGYGWVWVKMNTEKAQGFIRVRESWVGKICFILCHVPLEGRDFFYETAYHCEELPRTFRVFNKETRSDGLTTIYYSRDTFFSFNAGSYYDDIMLKEGVDYKITAENGRINFVEIPQKTSVSEAKQHTFTGCIKFCSELRAWASHSLCIDSDQTVEVTIFCDDHLVRWFDLTIEQVKALDWSDRKLADRLSKGKQTCPPCTLTCVEDENGRLKVVNVARVIEEVELEKQKHLFVGVKDDTLWFTHESPTEMQLKRFPVETLSKVSSLKLEDLKVGHTFEFGVDSEGEVRCIKNLP